ncbi:ATP-binding cassette sub-family A member 17-like [Battus philenor]|uniref:ATP-binding cassette sub-family A member 17-like n=1 Tax=Battus philenor TaxID=42288 RepID=UPI0035D0C7FE
MSMERRKIPHSRMQRHVKLLVWKSYLQRQRRWPILMAETLFAGIIFLSSIFIAKPVFLAPIQAEPDRPLKARDILSSLQNNTILGYAPNKSPFDKIMRRTRDLLNIEMLEGSSEDDLNTKLYYRSRGSTLNNPVIWIIWKKKEKSMWKLSIKSTERARLEVEPEEIFLPDHHLSTGFLAVQTAVSHAILEQVSTTPPTYDMCLVSMPKSALMQQPAVKKALAGILLCFTIALLPPVLEIEALVLNETNTRFKRALRIRYASFSSIYFGWIMYAYFTALPICLLAGITVTLIFRWVHLLFALFTVLAYKTVLILLAFIMAMFHNKAWVACTWTMLFTLMQTIISELLVYHKFDIENKAFTFLLQVILPPLGLVHAFNEFALLQSGREFDNLQSLAYPIVSWVFLIIFYYSILMLLQRTLGSDRAIGGQVSWKSIIFKKSADLNKLHRIEALSGNERDQLQEVDDLVAKAISFRNVSKCIMGNYVLSNLTFDIYRGEFTMLFADRVHQKMILTIEDLITGLTYAERGSITVLGHQLRPNTSFMNHPYMTGFCHRNEFLLQDLTVEEHLILYLEICLWYESSETVTDYGQVRLPKLLSESDLERVKNKKVKELDMYYQAQLCWAIALLLEPRIIIVDSSTSMPLFDAVIKDKIMRYKKYITIVKFCFSSIKLEFADRVFLFDNKILIFGGTPAYLFFKYGREYRLRLTFNCGSLENEAMPEILGKAHEAGAKVRAHLGSLLILRVPAFPTAKVAALVKDFTEKSEIYGITSMNISVPDSQEVYNRAIHDSKPRPRLEEAMLLQNISKSALVQVAEFPFWKRKRKAGCGGSQIKVFARKFFTFYVYYKIYLIMMMVSAILAGITIGISQSNLLVHLEEDHATGRILHGELLTVESTDKNTTLVLHLDNSSAAISVANSYVLSETHSTAQEIEKIQYTALAKQESLTEYLVTRAIDSPQMFVSLFAYGIDVSTNKNGNLSVRVLYSPLHQDSWTAPRAIARAYMALIRHYTGILDATIQVTDDPLGLDLTKWLIYAGEPPLLTQLLLTLTILHITHMPSKEHGLIRHMQQHALNFSPVCYWFSMFICDFVLYVFLVCLMTAIIIAIIYLVTPSPFFQYEDFAILPLLLTVYGAGCIPQAYLFSLGPQAALNSMIFIIVNIMLGETAIIAKIHYGYAWNYAMHFMSFSPQFNMAYAYSKIKKIFLYNMECVIFKTKNLCSSKTLHKCCEKCGVLQKCFKRQSYLFDIETGIVMELVAIATTSCMFMTVLLLWEYRFIQCLWISCTKRMRNVKYMPHPEALAVQREKEEAIEKQKIIRSQKNLMVNTFGEYLLAVDVEKDNAGENSLSIIRHLHLGIDKGEVKALSGSLLHGRRELCELLAGYKIPSKGKLWAMSRWEVGKDPHKYASQVALCLDRNPLPPWMTVFEALKLIAILRGVPNKHVKSEVMIYIDSLDLRDHAGTVIEELQISDRGKVHFAAAVVGAPPVLVLDEFTAYQKYSVRRAMYFILRQLRQRGHAIFISSSSVESHLPMTSRLAILVNGIIYDMDNVDNLVDRYSKNGYTVVLHLKDEVRLEEMLYRYFKFFVINDTSEVLVNVQILDEELTWMTIFEKLELLVAENKTVYSYIVTAIPIDYVYNWIVVNETRYAVKERETFSFIRNLFAPRPKIRPSPDTLRKLIPLEPKYNITKLKELPWSVIFHR